MRKANGRTTTLLLFLDSLFPKSETNTGYFLWRKIIPTVKHADDFVLLAKEETVLQGMTNRLTGIGRLGFPHSFPFRGVSRRSVMEMNVGKTKVMRISRQLSLPVHIIRDQKQPKNMQYFNYCICVAW
jgi:hypothetical protein